MILRRPLIRLCPFAGSFARMALSEVVTLRLLIFCKLGTIGNS